MAKRAKQNEPDPVEMIPEMVSEPVATIEPEVPAPAFLDSIPTVIVCGSTDTTQEQVDELQKLPVNIIVLNHAVTKYKWQDDRVTWAVYDGPECFPESCQSNPEIRQLIVPKYKKYAWVGCLVGKSINLLVPCEYEYQNIRGRELKLFESSPDLPVYGDNNCLCHALAYALRAGNQPVYLFDAELKANKYRDAARQIQFWSRDKSISGRIINMLRSSGIANDLPLCPLSALKDMLS